MKKKKNRHITAEDISLVSLAMTRWIEEGVRMEVDPGLMWWSFPRISREEEDFAFRLYLWENINELGEHG